MRKISLVLVAAMLLSVGSVFANDTKGKNPENSISRQITKMLSINDFSESEVDLAAQVRFTVNKEGEMVILSVDTDNAGLESFVKGRLNYKKIKSSELEEGKLFTVSVRIAS